MVMEHRIETVEAAVKLLTSIAERQHQSIERLDERLEETRRAPQKDSSVVGQTVQEVRMARRRGPVGGRLSRTSTLELWSHFRGRRENPDALSGP